MRTIRFIPLTTLDNTKHLKSLINENEDYPIEHDVLHSILT